jgi:glycosyltransferase involved in cell wall biosynthesis
MSTTLQDEKPYDVHSARGELAPVSVLIPTYNEEKNLPRCLEPLEGWADEIVIADSQSTDDTIAIAEEAGAEVIQFYYDGGWPKKRQWVLDHYNFRNEWILLLDADEILLDPVKQEIEDAMEAGKHNGYWMRFQIHFLGQQLRYGDTELWKLSLFRDGKGRYERRLQEEDDSSVIEVHQHVVVDGSVGKIRNPVRHENFNSLHRYIEKHNRYSEWEARLHYESADGEVQPSPFGNQAQRRRWLKHKLFHVPGYSVIKFLYHYVLRLGFLDGRPGLIYAAFKGVQNFHIKAKLYELKWREGQVEP